MRQQHDGASAEKTLANEPRGNRSPACEPKVAVAAINGAKALLRLAQECDIHPNQIKQWRWSLLAGTTGVFSKPGLLPNAKSDCSHCQAARHSRGYRAGDQPWQHLIPAAPSVGRRSETDAPDPQAAYGAPFRGESDVAGAAGTEEFHGPSAARCHTDEAQKHRGVASQAEHLGTGRGAQYLPRAFAETGHRPASAKPRVP